MSGTVDQLRRALAELTEPHSPELKAALDKIHGGEAPAKNLKHVAWAGASWETYAADADTFARLVAEAKGDQIVVAGLTVVFTDGTWLEWDDDEWTGKGKWKLVWPDSGPTRGDQPLTVIADPDGIEIDDANGQYENEAEASG